MVFSGGIRAGMRAFGSHLRGRGAGRPRQRCNSTASGGGVSAKQVRLINGSQFAPTRRIHQQNLATLADSA